MKSLTTLTTLLYFITIKNKILRRILNMSYFTTTKMKPLTMLTTLFHFVIIIKKIPLTMLTALFYFPTIR